MRLTPSRQKLPNDSRARVTVCVCICTFKRPHLLRNLLAQLDKQKLAGSVVLSISIADNDEQRSAQPIVEAFARRSEVDVTYACQPIRNIALARNTALEHASVDYVAFIDDDEFPDNDWLSIMIDACDKFAVSGVLGPVRPHFAEAPPKWIVSGRFFERPEPPTGTIMSWEDCRTGNVLLRGEILENCREPFDPAFGTGGEDKDFFRRMCAAGNVFCWCNEGAVYETVPKERWRRVYLLKRALLRGRNILKIPSGRTKLIAKSLVAAPIYLFIMPFALLRGQHVFMRYAIRFCDHAGRLLTLIGLNPVRDR